MALVFLCGFEELLVFLLLAAVSGPSDIALL
jgi:hypothetical protein